MKEEDLKALTDSMSTKLGEEGAATIADDLGKLITQNNTVLENISNLNKEIDDLKAKNEKLVAANSSLLQQVPMGLDIKPTPDERDNGSEQIDFRKLFDEKGNFKKTLD